MNGTLNRHSLHPHAEGAFRAKLAEAIDAHLEDPELDVEKLARSLYMSRAVLYRKIKTISNLPPKKLIHVIRLQRAASLLEEGTCRISEIAYRVGYSSHTVFGKNFLKQFGKTPLAYQGRLKSEKNS
ncbi:AraC family transcriptional regulator [Paraflavisolibacter sp. H34]|uniref:helix-turn-helix transcriptional regulator n=1 Tax=Huijunlia imazamoxiresistens TaxID=3127457 RepID=UPI003016EC8D